MIANPEIWIHCDIPTLNLIHIMYDIVNPFYRYYYNVPPPVMFVGL